jgi:hypothetical protein
MGRKKTEAFYAIDVASEILEVWGPHLHASITRDSAIEVASSLNRFYGIRLTEEDVVELSEGGLTIEVLVSRLQPMRIWPARMGSVSEDWDWRVELPNPDIR